MKTSKYSFFVMTLFTLGIMSSCVKVDLTEQRELSVDWSNRTAGINVPESYTVEINNQKLNYTLPTNILPELQVGTYPTYVYNTADKVSQSGTTVTVETTGSIVNSQPGWLFTSALDITAVADHNDSYTAVMVQQVRQLTFELSVTEGDPDRIASTTASLSGIANTLDFSSQTHSGVNLSVIPVFTRTDDKLTAVVRLLGITTENQELTLNITFTDGRTQTIVNDLSSQMTGFNSDKKTPLILAGNLLTPIKTGFTASINGWKVENGGDVVAW